MRTVCARGFIAVVAGAGVAFFLGRRFIEAASAFQYLNSSAVPQLILAATLMLVGVAGAGLGWVLLTGWLSGSSERTSAYSIFRVFFLTWPGRYVPGALPYHASRVILVTRLGISKSAAVSSIAYEGILQISSALAVGLIALAWTEKGPEQLIAVLAAALPLGLLSLSLRPSVLVSSLNRLLARLGKAPISSDAVPSPPNMLVLLGVYVLTYFVNGLAFYLVVHVVAPDVSLWLAISAFNLAGCAGIALMVFPSGIGVREAVIVALLSGHSSPEAAVQAAAVTRAVSVVTDILPVSLFSLFHLLLRLAGLLHRRRIQSEEDSAGLAEIATNP